MRNAPFCHPLIRCTRRPGWFRCPKGCSEARALYVVSNDNEDSDVEDVEDAEDIMMYILL